MNTNPDNPDNPDNPEGYNDNPEGYNDNPPQNPSEENPEKIPELLPNTVVKNRGVCLMALGGTLLTLGAELLLLEKIVVLPLLFLAGSIPLFILGIKTYKKGKAGLPEGENAPKEHLSLSIGRVVGTLLLADTLGANTLTALFEALAGEEGGVRLHALDALLLVYGTLLYFVYPRYKALWAKILIVIVTLLAAFTTLIEASVAGAKAAQDVRVEKEGSNNPEALEWGPGTQETMDRKNQGQKGSLNNPEVQTSEKGDTTLISIASLPLSIQIPKDWSEGNLPPEAVAIAHIKNLVYSKNPYTEDPFEENLSNAILIITYSEPLPFPPGASEEKKKQFLLKSLAIGRNRQEASEAAGTTLSVVQPPTLIGDKLAARTTTRAQKTDENPEKTLDVTRTQVAFLQNDRLIVLDTAYTTKDEEALKGELSKIFKSLNNPQ